MTDPAMQRTEREDFQATSDPALQESADRGEANLLGLRRALPALGAPAVGHPGPRLHPGPDRLARAHPRRGALPAHVRALVVLHRRAARGRRARPDDARRARRGDAHLPLHPDRRRGAPRRVLRPLLLRGRRARVGRPRGPARRDQRAPEPELRRAVRRDARSAASTAWPASRRTSRRWSRRSRSTTWSSRACSPSPGSTSSSATTRRWARCPGFVEGFNKVARDEHRHVAFGARFLRDMAQEDERYRDAIQRTLAECGPGGRRRADAALVRREDRAGALRRHARGDARVRDEGARAAAEGHRAGAGRRLSACA